MEKALPKLEALNFISEITLAMNQNGEPDQVLDQILSACIETSGADSGSIMLLDADTETLAIRASRGLSVEAASLRLGVGEGVTGWVALHRRPRLVRDARQEEDYISIREGLLSELALPLLAEDGLIGVLSVDALRAGAFNEEHQNFLSIMANLTARIFVNVRDNYRLKLRDRLHGVLIEISRIISQSIRLDEVFTECMGITEKAFGLFQSSLLLYDRGSGRLRVTASVGLSREEVQGISYEPGEGITGAVFINRTPEYIADVTKEPGFLNRMRFISANSGEVGFFCCPIFSGSDTVGVFSTFTRRQNGVESSILLEFLEILGSIISQAITIQKLAEEEKRIVEFENIRLKQQLSSRYKFGNLIGRSPPMLRLLDRVGIVAESRASVLITGDSGTGKELIATAIHYNSPRREQPFIKINCAAIPENLLESELFGHRKGSFTGAVTDKKGKIELADGGTIFLDEIGELDLNLQSKFLRVLQEREIEPIGGKPRSVDIRVIAATNANLEEKIAAREFRADLYYRLNVINLKLPTLRERREDILLLVHYFMDKYGEENGKPMRGISPEAVQLLENYEWPGNVRQLENIIERAVVLARDDVLTPTDFTDSTLPFHEGVPTPPPAETTTAGRADLVPVGDWQEGALPPEDRLGELEGRVYQHVLAEVEKRLILMALKRFRYTKTRAARFLGINRNTLDKKIKELEIEY